MVAPTRGTSDAKPAQNASSSANGTPRIVRNSHTAKPPVRATAKMPTT